MVHLYFFLKTFLIEIVIFAWWQIKQNIINYINVYTENIVILHS